MEIITKELTANPQNSESSFCKALVEYKSVIFSGNTAAV